jgi:hypothetical protein
MNQKRYISFASIIVGILVSWIAAVAYAGYGSILQRFTTIKSVASTVPQMVTLTLTESPRLSVQWEI